jgi:hypothetical protein
MRSINHHQRQEPTDWKLLSQMGGSTSCWPNRRSAEIGNSAASRGKTRVLISCSGKTT